jgi:hypothetical protein
MNDELRETIEAVKWQIDEADCPLCLSRLGDECDREDHLEECPLGQLFAYLEAEP